MKIESYVHSCLAIPELPFEVVEIKRRGHPDSICDLLCEQVSRDLLAFYQAECGRPLHYNVDKALLVGGQSKPKFGGGEILAPAKLYLGDRATSSVGDRKLPIDTVVRKAVAAWLEANVRFLRLGSSLEFINEIRPGSASLSAVEDRHMSNDTSVGVGSWPPTPLERAVLDLEQHLNSQKFKAAHPETGEDIKIMAARENETVKIVCAIAMVDRFITSAADYVEKKKVLAKDIQSYLAEKVPGQQFHVDVNTLDNLERGEAGLHLTVTGLSCEGGDSGQVGRGNRVNGTISFLRPQTMEAWAGKNPITHVGKIYSFAAEALAKRLCEAMPEILQADVFLLGQIGKPVGEPARIFCNLISHKISPALHAEANRFLREEVERGQVFQVAGAHE